MDNYYDTAKRMYKSSKTLHNNSEYHNACYLAGYVVECYAKVIVGLSYGFTHNDLKEFSHNLRRLDNELQYVLAHSAYATYIVDMRTDFSSILSGGSKWNPIKRYAEDLGEWNAIHSTNFQNQSRIAMQKLAQMDIDGYTLI